VFLKKLFQDAEHEFALQRFRKRAEQHLVGDLYAESPRVATPRRAHMCLAVHT
jgi:hypothetical protein